MQTALNLTRSRVLCRLILVWTICQKILFGTLCINLWITVNPCIDFLAGFICPMDSQSMMKAMFGSLMSDSIRYASLPITSEYAKRSEGLKTRFYDPFQQRSIVLSRWKVKIKTVNSGILLTFEIKSASSGIPTWTSRLAGRRLVSCLHTIKRLFTSYNENQPTHFTGNIIYYILLPSQLS